MDKNIKKIISEAFNELYDEMVNEAPATLKKQTISDNEVESMIEKAKATGRGISYDYTEGEKSQSNFNIIIDNLINDYKNTESPTREMSKKAIQNAFVPQMVRNSKGNYLPNKIYRLAGAKYITNPKLEDAESYAYEDVVIKRFDSLIRNYDTRSRGFSALIITSLSNKIHEYVLEGKGGVDFSPQDAMSGGRRSKAGFTKSMDDDYGDGRRFGDSFASEPSSKGDSSTSKMKEIKDGIITWLENHVDSKEFPVDRKQIAAFKGFAKGETTEEIFNNNPGLFTKSKDINIYFDRLVKGKAGKEISDLISSIYNMDFDLENISKHHFTSISSMSPEWSGEFTVSENMSKEMKEIFNEIKDFLSKYPVAEKFLSGLKAREILAQIPSNKEIEDNAKKLFGKPLYKLSGTEQAEVKEMSGWKGLRSSFETMDEYTVNTIKSLFDSFSRAAEKSKASGTGGFRAKETQIDISPQEDFISFMDKKGIDPNDYKNWEVRGYAGDPEDPNSEPGVLDKVADKYNLSKGDKEAMMNYAHKAYKDSYGGMFEGVKESDVEKLMERVFRRLSK